MPFVGITQPNEAGFFTSIFRNIEVSIYSHMTPYESKNTAIVSNIARQKVPDNEVDNKGQSL